MNLLRSPIFLVATLLLLIQTAIFYATPRGEYVPQSQPLAQFPRQVGDWTTVSESVLEQEILDQLKADDTVSRQYRRPRDPVESNLFVAFYKSQRAGQQPHSPKVCLPGSGWTPQDSTRILIAVPGEAQPIEVNLYTVSRGEYRSVVIYWYQSPHRVVASEYTAKLFTILDSVRYRRSDAASVRIVVPVSGQSIEQSVELAKVMAQDFFQPVRQYLPR